MNTAEKAWLDTITRLGCCVCHRQGNAGTPAEVHHLLSGGRKIGHLSTIPLCSPGHHRNGDDDIKISRHPNKARFEAAYGSECELLAWEREQVLIAGVVASVVAP